MKLFLAVLLALAALCGSANAQFGGWRDGRATFYGKSRSPLRGAARRARVLAGKGAPRRPIHGVVFFCTSLAHLSVSLPPPSLSPPPQQQAPTPGRSTRARADSAGSTRTSRPVSFFFRQARAPKPLTPCVSVCCRVNCARAATTPLRPRSPYEGDGGAAFSPSLSPLDPNAHLISPLSPHPIVLLSPPIL
jgi:hypothetical protein